MTRKRTIASILDASTLKSKPTENQEEFKIITRKRKSKVQYFCDKCNRRLVDQRTKKKHKSKLHSEQSLPTITPTDGTPLPIIAPDEMPIDQVSIEPFHLPIEQQLTQTTSDTEIYEEQIISFLLRKKRVKTGTFRPINIESTESNSDNSNGNVTDEYNGNNIDDICSDESSEDTADDKNDENNNKNDGEFFNVFENYSHLTFDLANILEFPKEDQFAWILIWIMKFRSNYKLSDAATKVLIKFIKLLLKECGNLNHELFPKSLYKVKQLLGLVDQFTSFAACQKCHKLYKKEDVEQDGIITKCNHIEFPNSTSKQSKKCETSLAKLVTLNNSISFRPELVYPVASIHQQLYNMFQRPGFEKSLRHWSKRPIFNDILSDIYNV